MGEFYAAELTVALCHENHVHLNLKAKGVDCPELGIALSADDARDLAMTLLESANEASPPQ